MVADTKQVISTNTNASLNDFIHERNNLQPRESKSPATRAHGSLRRRHSFTTRSPRPPKGLSIAWIRIGKVWIMAADIKQVISSKTHGSIDDFIHAGNYLQPREPHLLAARALDSLRHRSSTRSPRCPLTGLSITWVGFWKT